MASAGLRVAAVAGEQRDADAVTRLAALARNAAESVAGKIMERRRGGYKRRQSALSFFSSLGAFLSSFSAFLFLPSSLFLLLSSFFFSFFPS